MKLSLVIDMYVADMRSQGRINSDATEVAYRAALNRLVEKCLNRDPRYIGREDIKRTLAHWTHPNSQRTNRSILVSFFDYLLEEGIRRDNPARQTRRPRKRPPLVYRLTLDEAKRMLEAASGVRERRAIYLGICCGLRAKELRGLQGRHFERPGWVWVSTDIGKGARERWVPVIADLEPVVQEICDTVESDEYVLPAQRWRDVGINSVAMDKRKHPCSPQALYFLVKRVGVKAGISAPLHPHLLRHAYGDFIARFAGMRNAQFLLGHAGISTTETYVGKPTLDELAESVRGFSFRTNVLGGRETAPVALGRPTLIEPVQSASRSVEPEIEQWLASLNTKVRLYAEAFGAV